MQLNLIENSSITVNGETTVIGNLYVIQGGTFVLSVARNGDLSSYTARGEIRDNFLSKEGNLLASFSFLPLYYDATEDKTTVTFTLSDEVTSGLPITRYQGGSDSLSERTALVYDIELESTQGDVLKLIEASYIQVKPEVTANV